ncbi:MAG: hypothetical protein WC538_14690 [Thermoanaerobaculia bacterium]|jgi:hypothetical protein
MRLSAIAASALFTISLALPAAAEVRTWSQTGLGTTGPWTMSSLWSPVGAPQPEDDIMVTTSGTYSCRTGGNFSIRSLTMGGSGGTKVVEVSPSTGLAMTAGGAVVNSNAVLRVFGAITNGKIDVNNGATLRTEDGSMVTGSATISLKGGTFINQGTEIRTRAVVVTDTGLMEQRGRLVLGEGSQVTNRGLLFIYGGNIERGSGAGGSIKNESTTRIRTTAPVSIGVDMTNSGEFEIGNGNVTFNNSTYTQSAGKTTVNGGTLAGQIAVGGGTLSGTGTVTGSLSNGGTMALASPLTVGQMSVNGTYTQAPTGTLQIKIGGTNAFDKLLISGLATLGGQISLSFINGYVPPAGTQFPIISFGSWGNTFFAIQNGFQVGNVVMKPVYSSTGLTLVAQLAAVACGNDSLCLLGERFKVTLSARDPRTNLTGPGVPSQQNDVFGVFTIPALTGNTQNPEVIFKMLDGRPINGKFWVFYGGLTDFEYTLTIFDRTAGKTRTYTKPGGTFDGNADTSAFSKLGSGGAWFGIDLPPDALDASPPVASGEAACLSSGDSLCVLLGRFRIRLNASDPRTGKTGIGVALPQNDLYGYFSIPDLTGNPGNVEVAVKMLDGRPINGKFWIFYGGLTDFQYTVTVTDTEKNTTRTYTKPGGTFSGNADTGAF